MHGDEAVHAYKLDELLKTGRYEYDPFEFHGPTLYYLTLPVTWAVGARDSSDLSETHVRIVPALFGIAAVLLVWLLRDGLGYVVRRRGPTPLWDRFETGHAVGRRCPTLRAGRMPAPPGRRGPTLLAVSMAALLAAVSPVLVFYSRYYIQETLLSFFALAAIVAGWRFARSRHWGWAAACGAMLGCAHATKETSIIAFGCMGLALAGVVLAGRMGRAGALAGARDSDGKEVKAEHCTQSSGTRTGSLPHGRGSAGGAVLVGAVVAVAISVTFYSSFFTHAAGPLDSLRAVWTYVDRAGGEGAEAAHDKPWHYYLGTLLYTRYAPGPVWSESLIVVLALAGMVCAWRRPAVGADGAPLLRFLSLYTLLLAAAYSAIPYKTPWCMVQFVQPMTLLAGAGGAWLVSGIPALRLGTGTGVAAWAWRLAVGGLLAAATVQLAAQSYRTSFRFFADRRNPYVYAHPVMDVVRAGRWVERVAAAGPDGAETFVKVVGENVWPLPWYLRRMGRVGYWERIEDGPAAPIVVVEESLATPHGALFGNGHHVSIYGLRPGERVLVYVAADLYERFVLRQTSEQASSP